LNETERFCEKIRSEKLDVVTWRKYKKIQTKKESIDIFELGFSTFYLNRTNRSGIISAGVIGGIQQNGNYKMDCRFHKENLINRIKKISENRDKINLCNLDAIELIQTVERKKEPGTIFYFDPPYYVHGKSLYVNHYKHEDHQEVRDAICRIKNAHWVVSYDNVPEIENIY
jgi:DNA adenine methylase